MRKELAAGKRKKAQKVLSVILFCSYHLFSWIHFRKASVEQKAKEDAESKGGDAAENKDGGAASVGAAAPAQAELDWSYYL